MLTGTGSLVAPSGPCDPAPSLAESSAVSGAIRTGAPAAVRDTWHHLPPAVRGQLLALITALRGANRSTLAVAAALAAAARGRLAEACGFEHVEALAEALGGYRHDKTRALIAIHETYVRRLGRAEDALEDVPWTKLAALLPVVDERTVDLWLARARCTPLRVLRDEVRQVRTGHAPVPRVVKTFSVPADAAHVVELALDRIGRAAGTDDRGRQLELLAADALAGRLDPVPGETCRTRAVALPTQQWARIDAAIARLGAPTLPAGLLGLAEHVLRCLAPICTSENAALTDTSRTGGEHGDVRRIPGL